jgi:hypothetical protein
MVAVEPANVEKTYFDTFTCGIIITFPERLENSIVEPYKLLADKDDVFTLRERILLDNGILRRKSNVRLSMTMDDVIILLLVVPFVTASDVPR